MIQRQTQNILPARVYRQLKYTANDNKLPTTVSVSEENFSLAERIESVPVHFKDKMYQYILSQNQRPPTATLESSGGRAAAMAMSGRWQRRIRELWWRQQRRCQPRR